MSNKNNTQFNPRSQKLQGKQINELFGRMSALEANLGAAGELQSITVLLSDAEVAALHTTPIEIIADPGGDDVILIHNYTVSFDTDGGGYTNPSLFNLRFSNGNRIAAVTDPFDLAGASDSVETFYPLGGQLGLGEGRGAVQAVTSADPGAGDGDIEITVYYSVATIRVPAGISDGRLKDNITYLSDESINGLRLATWTWNDEAAKLGHTGQGFGVIAQDVQAVYPEVVFEGEDGYLRVKFKLINEILSKSEVTV